LTEPSGAQLRAAAESLETLLKARPDTGKEEPEYLAAMVKSLSWLTPEEHGWLTHPRDGLHTVLKFLPTPADVHQFLRERRARLEAVRPAPTTYHRLAEEPGPWDRETDFERKRRVVRECLGYNPGERGLPTNRTLETPSEDEVRSLRLKTPPAPASRELIEHLKAEGWPFIPQAYK
jgi:hypothetical protein